MLWHAFEALHAIVHFEPEAQEISWHASVALQLIAQFQPDGHVMLPQSPPAMQSTWHVFAFSSHDVHTLGQFGTTQ